MKKLTKLLFAGFLISYTNTAIIGNLNTNSFSNQNFPASSLTSENVAT